MKRTLLFCTIVILTLIMCSCGNEQITNGNIYDTYEDSLAGFIENESGNTDINTDDFVYANYEKDGAIYNLVCSKTQTSTDKDVFYLIRTMKIEDKFITDKVSEDADLSTDLTDEDYYSTAMMQNHSGDVFFVVVRVLNDDYIVTFDGKECENPQDNIYVQVAESEPQLEITKTAATE